MSIMVPVQVTGLTDKRVLVVVEKVAATPDRYPRRTGVPAKRPTCILAAQSLQKRKGPAPIASGPAPLCYRPSLCYLLLVTCRVLTYRGPYGPGH